MKRIGLIGGMSWESSALYYSLINELVREQLGGLHSANCIMTSLDFAVIERLQAAGEWTAAGAILADEARSLEAAGADLLVLCTNTMHKVADVISAAVAIPLLHIGDVAARAVVAAGIRHIGLLGTRFTMGEQFYRDRLERAGLNVLVPSELQQELVNRVIYDELVLGIVTEQSRTAYQAVIDDLGARGAEGVILGCTEIELLISQADASLPIFPTTRLHAEAAVRRALGG